MLNLNPKISNEALPIRCKGFTLLEMSIVLLIVGLLLSGLFVALGDSAANRNRISAAAQLENIKEALYGFAQSTGRLPCPAQLLSDGIEDPIGGGDCAVAHGFIPAVTLGLQGPVDTDALLLDPWGNPYRYSVAVRDAPNGDRSLTSVDGMKSQFAVGALPDTTGLICIANGLVCTGQIYANTVPALIYSMGADYGYYTSTVQLENAESPSAPPTNPHRLATDNNFYNGIFSEEGTLAFDDILVWISPNILYSRMITAGKLP